MTGLNKRLTPIDCRGLPPLVPQKKRKKAKPPSHQDLNVSKPFPGHHVHKRNGWVEIKKNDSLKTPRPTQRNEIKGRERGCAFSKLQKDLNEPGRQDEVTRPLKKNRTERTPPLKTPLCGTLPSGICHKVGREGGVL